MWGGVMGKLTKKPLVFTVKLQRGTDLIILTNSLATEEFMYDLGNGSIIVEESEKYIDVLYGYTLIPHIRRGKNNGHQERYSTLKEAQAGHQKAVKEYL